ncbi:MAG: DUF4368 domain-containing protein [Ruminococcus sp.]|nr:DUF4368 domain-containing protein [Ruminococcus sp.]
MAKVKRITNPTELTPELVNEFIDKIVLSAPCCYQIIDIHYKGVGIVNELSPEDFEKGLQAYIAKRRQKSA